MKNKFDVFFWIGLVYTTIPVFLVVISSTILIDIYNVDNNKSKVVKKEIYVEPQQPVVIGESKIKEVINTQKPVVVIIPKPKVTVQDTAQDTAQVIKQVPDQVVDSTKKSK